MWSVSRRRQRQAEHHVPNARSEHPPLVMVQLFPALCHRVPGVSTTTTTTNSIRSNSTHQTKHSRIENSKLGQPIRLWLMFMTPNSCSTHTRIRLRLWVLDSKQQSTPKSCRRSPGVQNSGPDPKRVCACVYINPPQLDSGSGCAGSNRW